MDSLCLKAGITGMPTLFSASVGIDVRPNPTLVSTAAVGRSSTSASAASNSISVDKPSVSVAPHQRMSPWGFSFKYPLRSLWPAGRNRYDAAAVEEPVLDQVKEDQKEVLGGNVGDIDDRVNRNWVLKILHVRSLWKEEEKLAAEEPGEKEENLGNANEESGKRSDPVPDDECDECKVYDENIEFDRHSFSKLLRRVSFTEIKLFAKLSYLGSLAYSIPQIKPGNLLKRHGLNFVTSSLELKEQALKAEKEEVSAQVQDTESNSEEPVECKEYKTIGNRISASAAYQVAASAASYLHSHTKSILPFKFSHSDIVASQDSVKGENGNTANVGTMNSEMASLMATTDSVTAVVAAKEEVKQAVADDLKSRHSSPCEWFICDDKETSTRFFVIQGSETLASWKANLLFEPIRLEDLDVLVHRGIYEAAKGIYEQMLPEVRAHLKSHGNRATFRFTGHSLGGSLSLLVNLMLLIRGEVPSSSLLPVITFGAPSIMCGGDRLLAELGLPLNHVQAVTMHRDIVPRAFSCNYPSHVAELLKAVSGNFRNYPCLKNQRLLYAPMGEFLILQPDEKFSPSHHLLPSGCGLYTLKCSASDAGETKKQVQSARSVFLNSPHPLEILSDRSAYGSEGTIQRDHDMNSYLKSIRSVIRQEARRLRKVKREHRRRLWWPLVAPWGVRTGVVAGRPLASHLMEHGQIHFSGMLNVGRESLKRFSRLVTSQHMQLLVVLLLPARLLIVGAFSIIRSS